MYIRMKKETKRIENVVGGGGVGSRTYTSDSE